jgi:hypothetical protein
MRIPIIMSDKVKDASDFDDLWMPSELGDGIVDVRRSSITVGKPKDFFRVHPDNAFRRRTEIYVHKVEGQIDEQTYILAPNLWGRLEEANHATLVAVVYRDGTPRLWAVKTPKEGERDNEAWASARAAAKAGISNWVKVVWSRGRYVVREAQAGYAPEPDWLKFPTWEELIRLGFGENGVIRDESHPIYRDLFGQARAPGDDEI